jgi:NADH dehydrogenase
MSPQQEELHVVTGAFGYSGKYIARRLLDAGHQVRTLTSSVHRINPFGGAVDVRPFQFDRPAAMAESLRGASLLYNTYWVRFNHKMFRHNEAVENTLALFDAAKQAGIKRVVHVSITNPSEDSPLEYFSGKARLERALIESGMSYAILRPTVLFGKEDILVNNIAWSLRKFPVMGIFGDGQYQLQPIYVDDLARLAVEQGAETENRIIDAIGPETFTYRELVETIGRIIGCPRKLVRMPPWLGCLAGKAIGACVGDVMITREEIKGLMAGLLAVDSPPAGETRLTDWAREHAHELGQRYTSELARRKDRDAAYEQL